MRKLNGVLGLVGLVIALVWYQASFYVPEQSQREHTLGAHINQTHLPTTLQVLVWNIYKENRVALVDDYKKYAADAELVLLQEAIAPDNQLSTVLNSETLNFFMATSFERKRWSSVTQNGVATGASAVPSESIAMLAPKREFGFTTPKAMTANYYHIAGSEQSVLVLNIHALNFVFFSAYQTQIDQALTLINKHQGPVIFAGDFNTNFPQGEKKQAYLMQAMQNTGLEKVSFHPDARKFVNTKCDIASEIDYVFERGFTVLEAYVPDSAGSDHCPLMTRLKLET